MSSTRKLRNGDDFEELAGEMGRRALMLAPTFLKQPFAFVSKKDTFLHEDATWWAKQHHRFDEEKWMRCFRDEACLDLLDRQTFKFQHQLMDHPALSLQNLANVLPALPAHSVMSSKGLLSNGDDFEDVMCGNTGSRFAIEAVIENIRTSDSYIMVNGPEEHPSFQPLYKELIADVEQIMKRRGLGNVAISPKLYLFIASPNSVTPFHIDRYSGFLMQFRGSKHVSIFPQWDERVVSSQNKEAYVANKNTRLPWDHSMNELGKTFEFHPGEALHIPFSAGHHVRNGSEDVSISMSIFFSTDQSHAWRQALRFNHAARPVLRRLGLKPAAVGRAQWRDSAKSGAWTAIRKLKSLRGA
ncbi:cupin-like domain-containing protein [Xenophilus aerolatus]